jgi:hypothetical protein
MSARVVLVHGFQFDPSSPMGHKNNPHSSLFPLWEDRLGEYFSPIRFAWYSVPRTWKDRIKAWRAGYRKRYNWAWAKAEDRGLDLRKSLQSPTRYSFLCHSLGSRVVMSLLDTDEDMSKHVDRVLLLNGAEHTDRCRKVALRQPNIKFLNIAVYTDLVLEVPGAWFSPKFGRHDTVGQKGLGGNAPSNWHEVHLDDPTDQAWGHRRGWDLKGDNKRSILDHWMSYTYKGNWPMYKAFLVGDLNE